MSILTRSGEQLARSINRRKFMKRTAVVIFGFTTGAMVSLDQWRRVFASPDTNCPGNYCPSKVGNYECDECSCSLPNGTLCPSCSGYNCGSGCTPDDGSAWGNACWCTAQCYNGSDLIYYVCCDCWCKNHTLHCGCEQEYTVE